MAKLTVTKRKPRPPKADFGFSINFKRGEGSASRVFLATHDFIRACERLDKELLASIDSSIQTVMVLEDIEAGSIKTWLRNNLRSTDDQSLKELDWKTLVGHYLVKAKYLVLEWIDDSEAPKDLPKLGQDIQQLASETNVRHLPDYSPVRPDALLAALTDFQKVKDHLVEGDSASVVSDSTVHEMDLKIRWDIEDIQALAIKETQIIDVPSMMFIVKKPDYIGTSKWDLRLGKKAISAKFEDEQWLNQFQSRDVDVRPGDALRCQVRIEMSYGHDNELIAERYFIAKVESVVENQYQPRLFDESEKS